MIEVVVPKWGLTMEDAVLVEWLCAVGDEVSDKQPLAEIETDKADGEVESPSAGVVVELLVEPGAELVPGQVIARIDGS